MTRDYIVSNRVQEYLYLRKKQKKAKFSKKNNLNLAN